MPKATDKIAPTGADDNARGARLALMELEAPIRAMSAATSLLTLVAAGLVARRADHAFAPWEGEALEYLAEHIQDLAETVCALRDRRPPAWTVGAPFRPALRPGNEA